MVLMAHAGVEAGEVQVMRHANLVDKSPQLRAKWS
jgi:hypothetical protein